MDQVPWLTPLSETRLAQWTATEYLARGLPWGCQTPTTCSQEEKRGKEEERGERVVGDACGSDRSKKSGQHDHNPPVPVLEPLYQQTIVKIPSHTHTLRPTYVCTHVRTHTPTHMLKG